MPALSRHVALAVVGGFVAGGVLAGGVYQLTRDEAGVQSVGLCSVVAEEVAKEDAEWDRRYFVRVAASPRVARLVLASPECFPTARIREAQTTLEARKSGDIPNG